MSKKIQETFATLMAMLKLNELFGETPKAEKTPTPARANNSESEHKITPGVVAASKKKKRKKGIPGIPTPPNPAKQKERGLKAQAENEKAKRVALLGPNANENELEVILRQNLDQIVKTKKSNPSYSDELMRADLTILVNGDSQNRASLKTMAVQIADKTLATKIFSMTGNISAFAVSGKVKDRADNLRTHLAEKGQFAEPINLSKYLERQSNQAAIRQAQLEQTQRAEQARKQAEDAKRAEQAARDEANLKRQANNTTIAENASTEYSTDSEFPPLGATVGVKGNKTQGITAGEAWRTQLQPQTQPQSSPARKKPALTESSLSSGHTPLLAYCYNIAHGVNITFSEAQSAKVERQRTTTTSPFVASDPDTQGEISRAEHSLKQAIIAARAQQHQVASNSLEQYFDSIHKVTRPLEKTRSTSERAMEYKGANGEVVAKIVMDGSGQAWPELVHPPHKGPKIFKIPRLGDDRRPNGYFDIIHLNNEGKFTGAILDDAHGRSQINQEKLQAARIEHEHTLDLEAQTLKDPRTLKRAPSLPSIPPTNIKDAAMKLASEVTDQKPPVKTPLQRKIGSSPLIPGQ